MRLKLRIRLFKNKSVFLSWLATYFLMLLMPVLISVVVYFEAYKIVGDDMIHENSQALKQAGAAIDSGMQDVRKFDAFVAFSQNLNLLIQEKDLNYIESHYYLVNSTLSDLKSSRFQNEYIQDFYIYLRQVDSVLTTNGFYDSKYFFEHYEKGTIYRNIMSYDDWERMMNTGYTGAYRTFEAKSRDTGQTVQSAIVLHSLPIFGDSQPKATFVISLDYGKYMELLGNIGPSKDSWGFIVDKTDAALFSTKPGGSPFPVAYASMGKDSDLIYTKVDGRDVAVTYNTSGVEDWKYVSVTPLQAFQAKVSYIRNLIIAGIAFSIALGGVLAWFFSRRNYRPVNELIRSIESKFRPPSDKETNEYRFIQGAMDATFSEKDEISERLRRQNLILRSSFLVRLLKGRFENDSFIARALDMHRLDFQTGSFAVMLFCPAGNPGMHTDGSADGAGETLEAAGLLVTRAIEGIAGKENKAYAAEADRMMACIVNFKGLDKEGCRRLMLQSCAEACAFLRQECGMEALAAASDIHDTMFGIPDAYQEALSVMEYKKVMDAGDIVAYDELNVSSQGYSYPIETERQLINCIKAGDPEAASACLNEIFEKNFSKTVLSASLSKCLVFDLVGTVFKTVSETNALKEGTFIKELDIAGRLLDSGDFQEMKQRMTGIVEEICTHIQLNKKPRKDSLLEQVIDHIERNYQDANLSVSQIADKFQLTPAYLTRLFKEQSGEGLLDYITGVRMEKAKQLLRKQTVNIKDVAARVGYYSSTAFIRTFKKMEGVTPGSYKDIG